MSGINQHRKWIFDRLLGASIIRNTIIKLKWKKTHNQKDSSSSNPQRKQPRESSFSNLSQSLNLFKKSSPFKNKFKSQLQNSFKKSNLSRSIHEETPYVDPEAATEAQQEAFDDSEEYSEEEIEAAVYTYLSERLGYEVDSLEALQGDQASHWR